MAEHADLPQDDANLPNPAARALHDHEALVNDDGEFDAAAREHAAAKTASGEDRTSVAGVAAGGLTATPNLLKGTTAGLHHDNSGWTSLGPHQIGGRTLAILPVKQKQGVAATETTDVLYAGTASGGVWYSDDKGLNWVPTQDLMGNMAVASLIADPDDPTRQTIYAGTGEGSKDYQAKNKATPRGSGIFKTTDGWSWTQVEATRSSSNDDFLAVNRLVLTSGNDTLVAATKGGIYFSTRETTGDKDFKTWTKAELKGVGDADPTALTESIGCVAAHPTNQDLLIAGTMQTYRHGWSGRPNTAKVYVSRDRGRLWEELAFPTVTVPSATGGSPTTSPLTASGRVDVCFAAATVPTGMASTGTTGPTGASATEYPAYVFIEKAHSSADGHLWRFLNDGTNTNLEAKGEASGVFGTSGQGWYDICLWAGDPKDADLIVVGGVNLMRSTDGGTTFTNISRVSHPWWPHTDQHFLIEDHGYDGETNRRLWVGNDGGIYTTENIATVAPHRKDDAAVADQAQWEMRNNGYNAVQFYYGTGNVKSRVVIAGAQDNGTIGHTPGNHYWDEDDVLGGDGTCVLQDPEDENRFYAATQNLGLQRMTRSVVDGKAKWSSEGIYGHKWKLVQGNWVSNWFGAGYFIKDKKDQDDPQISGQKVPFVAAFILDPNRSKAMYVGGTSLWRTLDATVAVGDPTTPGATSVGWKAVYTPPLGAGMVSAIAATNVPLADDATLDATTYTDQASNRLLVGYGKGKIYRTDAANVLDAKVDLTNATTASQLPQWTDVTPISGSRKCLCLAFDPNDPDIAYAGYGGFVDKNLWKSIDGGSIWTDISGTLPNVPVHSVTVHPSRTEWIYAGTDLGLFASEDRGVTWAQANEGPSSVAVSDMFWIGTTLMAVTFGRGIFQIDISIRDQAHSILYGDKVGQLTTVKTDMTRTRLASQKLRTGTAAELLSPALVVQDTISLGDAVGRTRADKVKDTIFTGSSTGAVYWRDVATLAVDQWNPTGGTKAKQFDDEIQARPELWAGPDSGLNLVVSDVGGKLRVIDLDTDTYATDTINVFTPSDDATDIDVFSNGVVDNWAYVASDQGLYGVRLVGDEPGVEWSEPSMVCRAAPLIAHHTLYVGHAETGGTTTTYNLAAIDVRTGERKWAADKVIDGEPGQPVWSYGAVVVGTSTGKLIGFNHTDGEELFNATVEEGSALSGITANDLELYFAVGSTVHKWTLTPGTRTSAGWTATKTADRTDREYRAAYTPVLVGDKLFVATKHRFLHCLEASLENYVWQSHLSQGAHIPPVAIYPSEVTPTAVTSTAGLSAAAAGESGPGGEGTPEDFGLRVDRSGWADRHPAGSLDHAVERVRAEQQATAADADDGGGESPATAVVMVLDISGSMEGDHKMERLRTAAEDFVYELRNQEDNEVMDSLGIVTFDSSGQYFWGDNDKVQPLLAFGDNDAADLKLSTLGSSGRSTNIGDGLAHAKEMLAGVTGPKAVLLVSDGVNDRGASPEPSAMSVELQGLGIRIFTVGVGSGADTSLLSDVASKDEWAHHVDDPDVIDEAFIEILNSANIINVLANETHRVSHGQTATSAEVTVPTEASQVSLSAVWSDPALNSKYETNPAGTHELALELLDENDAAIPEEHLKVRLSHGSCVVYQLDLSKFRPGRVKAQASTRAVSGETAPDFSITLSISSDRSQAELHMTQSSAMVAAGEPMYMAVAMTQPVTGAAMEIVDVQAHVVAPTVHPDEAMATHAEVIAELQQHAEANGRPLSADSAAMTVSARLAEDGGIQAHRPREVQLEQLEAGLGAVIVHTDTPGVHRVAIRVTGIDPETGVPHTISRQKTIYAH